TQDAMKFVIEDVFRIAPDAYIELYFDEPFNVELGEYLGLGRELRKLERASGRVVRQICCEPKREKGSDADKAFGASRASFVENMTFDIAARRGDWETIPNMLPDRVKTAGTLELVAVPEGTKRIVRGACNARLWGFGGVAERAIVREIEKNYVRMTKFTT